MLESRFMRPRLLAAVGLVAILTSGSACAGRLVPEASRPWNLRGAVVSTDGQSVTVRHKSGQVVVLSLDERTEYVRDERPSALSALTPGVRVRVDVVPDAQRARAARVTVF